MCIQYVVCLHFINTIYSTFCEAKILTPKSNKERNV